MNFDLTIVLHISISCAQKLLLSYLILALPLFEHNKLRVI